MCTSSKAYFDSLPLRNQLLYVTTLTKLLNTSCNKHDIDVVAGHKSLSRIKKIKLN